MVDGLKVWKVIAELRYVSWYWVSGEYDLYEGRTSKAVSLAPLYQ